MLDKDMIAYALRERLGSGQGPPDPERYFARMMDFYADCRVGDARPLDEDGDMLLYEAGENDWGDGPVFELRLTRQLIFPDGEDQEIWHLAFSFTYDPDAVLASIEPEQIWCARPDVLAGFRAALRVSPGWLLCAERDLSDFDFRWSRV